MATKHLTPTEIDVKAVQEDGFFVGYASVFNVKDRGGDIVAPDAFKASLQQIPANRVKMLWHHKRDEPIGVWEKFEVDAHGLKATGRLILETARGREAHALMKAGAIDGLSIGYRTVRDRYDRVKSARILEDVLLEEVSLVSFPMNTESTVTTVKSSSERSDLVEAIRAATSKIKEIA